MMVPTKAYKERYAEIEWKPFPKRERPRLIETARSSLPAPMLIRDGMDSTLNHVDGQRYESKSAFRKATKIAGDKQGKTYVEVGNDSSFKEPPAPRPYDNMNLKQDIKDAYDRTVGV